MSQSDDIFDIFMKPLCNICMLGFRHAWYCHLWLCFMFVYRFFMPQMCVHMFVYWCYIKKNFCPNWQIKLYRIILEPTLGSVSVGMVSTWAITLRGLCGSSSSSELHSSSLFLRDRGFFPNLIPWAICLLMAIKIQDTILMRDKTFYLDIFAI